MLRTHLSCHTVIFSLALAVASAACSSGGASEDAPPADTGLEGQGASGGHGGRSSGHGGARASGGSGPTSEDPRSEAGEADEPDEPGEPGEPDEPSGSGGATGSAAGSAAAGSTTAGSAAGSTSSQTNGGNSGRGGDSSGGGGVAGSVSSVDPAIARGLALATKNMCTTCHQLDYSGLAIYANITPDLDTGIGAWTDEEIAGAIREQKGKDNATLCNLMVPFPFTDAQVGDLIAFLRSLPPVTNEITSVCPGHVP